LDLSANGGSAVKIFQPDSGHFLVAFVAENVAQILDPQD
jgi:hypothetical protein